MKRILMYGDSNTFGANPNCRPDMPQTPAVPFRWPDNIRWPKLVQKILGDEYEVIEEGLCGRTTVFRDQAWPYCEGRNYYTPCVSSHYPLDLVVIMLGTNDLKTEFAPCPDHCGLAMMELLKVAKNPFLYNDKMPKILVVSPIFVGDKIKDSFMYGTFTENSLEVSHKLPKIYEGIAKQFGCEFMRASDFAKASDADSIHMDEANHASLAKGIAEKILSII